MQRNVNTSALKMLDYILDNLNTIHNVVMTDLHSVPSNVYAMTPQCQVYVV